MLTLDSIIAATKQMGASGEGAHAAIPRDRGARPSNGSGSAPSVPMRDEDADPADRDA